MRAIDAAGNLGDASQPLTVTTPAAPADPPPAPGGGGGGGSGLPPDLGIALSTHPATPVAGAPVDVLATVSNDAAAGSATTVVATIELPAGATLLGPPAYERGAGCSGTTTLICPLDFLPNGLATTLRWSFSAPAAGTLSATVAAAEFEPDLTDNRASVEIAAPPPVVKTAATPAIRAPAAPAWLRAKTQNGKLTLTWGKSADDHRVRAYAVFRDGVLKRRARIFIFAERALRGRHVYTVRALDANGLRSAAKRIVVQR